MIGRKDEVKRIQYLLDTPKAEMLAVTGRRRVGKTFLIDQTLGAYYCFSMTGIQQGNFSAQLANFSSKLFEYNGIYNPMPPKNWQMALIQLKAYLRTLDPTKKQVIFIDEISWVHTKRSKFIQFLAHLWNDYLSKTSHFILVICGSSTSWITKKILNDVGGFHNRVSDIIYLSPFNLLDTLQFLKARGFTPTIHEVTQIYMILGGIPYYLKHLNSKENFVVGIARLFFSEFSIFKNEYRNLYYNLFQQDKTHKYIVEILAHYQGGLTRQEILKKLNKYSTGTYQRAMEALIISDFVVEDIPFGKKKRGTIYRLVDEYSIFYHRFIKPNSKYIAGMWQQLAASQTYKIWAGYAFEALCHKHIDGIKRALQIGAVYTEVSNLRVQGTKEQAGFQIDLLIDRKDDCINLCEIKFYNQAFTITKAYSEQLQAKRQRFINFTKTKKLVFITLITNHGLTKNDYATSVVDVAIELKDILKYTD